MSILGTSRNEFANRFFAFVLSAPINFLTKPLQKFETVTWTRTQKARGSIKIFENKTALDWIKILFLDSCFTSPSRFCHQNHFFLRLTYKHSFWLAQHSLNSSHIHRYLRYPLDIQRTSITLEISLTAEEQLTLIKTLNREVIDYIREWIKTFTTNVGKVDPKNSYVVNVCLFAYRLRDVIRNLVFRCDLKTHKNVNFIAPLFEWEMHIFTEEAERFKNKFLSTSSRCGKSYKIKKFQRNDGEELKIQWNYSLIYLSAKCFYTTLLLKLWSDYK